MMVYINVYIYIYVSVCVNVITDRQLPGWLCHLFAQQKKICLVGFLSTIQPRCSQNREELSVWMIESTHPSLHGFPLTMSMDKQYTKLSSSSQSMYMYVPCAAWHWGETLHWWDTSGSVGLEQSTTWELKEWISVAQTRRQHETL